MSLKPAPTVLLVDDEDKILASLQRSLRREGYRLLVAQGARQALRVLRDEPVDLVVSDHKMPGMSGKPWEDAELKGALRWALR